MRSRSLTAAGALIAVVLSGFVPAPASVSLFGAAAEAKQPRQGGPKGKSKKPRARTKGKAPAEKQAAKAQKNGTRKNSNKSSKPKTKAVAGKAAGTSRPVLQAGNRKAGTFEAMAGARRNPPPLPPRAAQTTRDKGKAPASPAKQVAKSQKKAARRGKGETSTNRKALAGGRPAGSAPRKTRNGKGKRANLAAKPGLAIPMSLLRSPPTSPPPPPPLPPRLAQSPHKTGKTKAPPAMQTASKVRKEARIASEASSVMTRVAQPLGGGAPITGTQAQQAKPGKKYRFYFNPFRGLFNRGKKK